MFSKLLFPITVGIPSLALSSPIIYATSTSKRYSDMWVARFEDGGGSLLQCISANNHDRYDILLNFERIERQNLLLNVLKNSSEKVDESKLGLKWTRGDKNLSLMKINEEDQYPQQWTELATCTPSGEWIVKEEQNLTDGYWIGNLMTLTASLTLRSDQNCAQSLFKVECRVHVDSGKINTTGSQGAIKLEGKLPSLIYRPF